VNQNEDAHRTQHWSTEMTAAIRSRWAMVIRDFFAAPRPAQQPALARQRSHQPRHGSAQSLRRTGRAEASQR
jgi:hypothetical protein